jgi:hypothetical protein
MIGAHTRATPRRQASGRLGGRLEAVEMGGVPANVGASWIHHAEGNPISVLAAR